ncbi:5-oxoprolinase subunit PxpB [Marinobacter mobilis]|uniref:5-oxoprolinase subunit PxpB n=1 Tax=Marinobacter mobilis TaxID=488533 RepID=UPI0035C6BB33
MIDCVSENSALVTLGRQISPRLTARIAALCDWLEQQSFQWLIDLVPSYTTVLVVYDPMQLDFRGVKQCLNNGLSLLQQTTVQGRPGTVHEIPVYYAPETGPDLGELATQKGLSESRVIELHSQREYQVYAIGFMPGFGFLGTVDPQIQAPRKATPRALVPAGSVAIANEQTAIYPKASPGGWQLIGRSPAVMFDRQNLSRFRIGDRVRFVPVSRADYLGLGGRL